MKYAERPGPRARLRASVDRARSMGPRGAAAAAARAASSEARRLSTAAWRDVAGRVLATRPAPPFHFDGATYRYHRHHHNATWRNERAVELPIVQREVEQAGDAPVLEVGNVLSHYFPRAHEVIDKYERAAGVVNVDVLDFDPPRRYALIVSISTLEHVGFDDEDRDDAKPARAVARLRTLLAPGGRAVVTAPLGYNPHLDEALVDHALGFDRVAYLKRTGMTRWHEASLDDVAGTPYGAPFPGANALAIGYLEP